MLRIAAAFLVAPGAYPVAATLHALATHSDYYLVAGPTIAMFTYSTALVLGLPVYILYRAWGLCRWWQYVLGGGAIGAVVAVSFMLLGNSNWRDFLLVASLAGALSGLVFWFIGVWKSNKRMDGDAVNRARHA